VVLNKVISRFNVRWVSALLSIVVTIFRRTKTSTQLCSLDPPLKAILHKLRDGSNDAFAFMQRISNSA